MLLACLFSQWADFARNRPNRTYSWGGGALKSARLENAGRDLGLGALNTGTDLGLIVLVRSTQRISIDLCY